MSEEEVKPRRENRTVLQSYRGDNYKWIGNCAQLASPIFADFSIIIAAYALKIGTDIQQDMCEVAESNLQETNFARAVDNLRRITELTSHDDVARGRYCIDFLAELPDRIPEAFEERSLLFGERILEAVRGDAQASDEEGMKLRKDYIRCTGPQSNADLDDPYLLLGTRYVAYLNSVSVSLSTWTDMEKQNRLVGKKKRSKKEF
jgi:hypothetical protein